MSAVFSNLTFHLSQLVDMIDHGSIGLPEIQRPFVWKRTKVRDLFDSMYRGFPVGYFLFWRNASPGARQIGANAHQVVPDRMIVDGQQRLTSLYSVLKGQPVIDENYREARIEIGFNPVDGTFAVTSAAHRRHRQWIPDVAMMWQPGTNVFRFVSDYVARLREDVEIDDELEQRIGANIDRLLNLRNYQFTAIELSADTEAEAVADIFVRINSAGVELNQADFILTLMSVYWDSGRKQLEEFCKAAKTPSRGTASPFNYFLDPSPDQLLRVVIGFGFRRGRLKAVYNLLRGKELDSEGRTGSARNFEILAEAQQRVLDLTNWHQFLQCVTMSGFRSGKLITADNTLLYSYVLFLIGKVKFGVSPKPLRLIIARWIFMSGVTSRYSGSYESTIEADLNRLDTASNGQDFVDLLNRIISEILTDDYWAIRLPSELETTAARSPALYAYYAALNLLDARVLFSPMSVRELLDPAIRGDRLAIERHHLFPKAYLRTIGYESPRDFDQIANFALLEWPDNVSIGAKSPSTYAPPLFDELAPAERARMTDWHALPSAWYDMDYPAFLAARRRLIAQVVRQGFLAIGSAAYNQEIEAERTPSTIEALIDARESARVEFKSTARWSLKGQRVDDGVELAIVKSVAGFLNSSGGTLVIGLADDGSAVGLEHDYATLRKKDRDGFELWLTDLLQTTLGKTSLTFVAIHFDRVGDHDVARVDVAKASRIIFANPKGTAVDDVYVRFGVSTRKLTPAEVLQYHADWSDVPFRQDRIDQEVEKEDMPEGL